MLEFMNLVVLVGTTKRLWVSDLVLVFFGGFLMNHPWNLGLLIVLSANLFSSTCLPLSNVVSLQVSKASAYDECVGPSMTCNAVFWILSNILDSLTVIIGAQ